MIVCPSQKNRRARGGITLIEVVAGLALLGGLLTMMLVAAGKLERQQRVSESKLNAVAQLDRLVSGFFSNGFPNLPSSGQLDQENKRWVWRLQAVQNEVVPGCSVVRFSVIDLEGALPDGTPAEKTLATLEVVVSDSEFGRNFAMSGLP